MATLLLESLFSSANQESGIETSALRGVIDRANLPANIGSGSTGDSTRSFIIKKTPASDVSLITPTGSDSGSWSDWMPIESSEPITANQAGSCIILANLYANSQGAPAGGGDRIFINGRIMRVRGGDSLQLQRSKNYGPRNLPAGSGTTSQAFSDASKETSQIIGVLAELETGDIIRIDARAVHQATSGTKTIIFKSDENFLEIANWSANPTGQGGRTDSEINNLITTFLNALPSSSLTTLKTQLDVLGDSDINSLIHTYLNSLNATDIAVLKTALGVKTDTELRNFIEDDLDTETIKRILSNIPDKSVSAKFLKEQHADFGPVLPPVTGRPDGNFFLQTTTGFVFTLLPSQRTAVTNRNRIIVTPTNDIFLLDNGLFQDNYNDFVGRIENRPTGNSRQLEVFLRSDLLDDLNIDTTEDSAVKLYVDIGGTTIGLHRYPNSEQISFPDILRNVTFTAYEAPVGTTATLTNNQRLNVLFYRDSNKTQPINIKPEFVYSAPRWVRVTGDSRPDLSHFLTQDQIEGLIKSEQDEGESLLDFNFTGASGSIDRAAVTESPALTNSFVLGDSTIIIKKIVQFTHDNAIEITTSPTLYNLQSEPDEELIDLFKDIKIKINDLTLSFGAAIASVDSSGYSWDSDENETYWQFDGREPGTVRIGSNKVEIFSPLEPYNYVPKGGAVDNGRTLKWNNTTERPEWEAEAGLDQSVTDQLEDQKEFEKALRYRTNLGSSSINITQPGTGQNTSKRVPAFRTGKDDHFILAVAGQEYEFSAADLYAKPRTPIGTLTSSNALEFGDTTKFFIARSSGSVQDFLFTSSVAGTYAVVIYSYNIDIQDAARASSTPLEEFVEDTMTNVLDIQSSEIAINHIDASNKIELDVKAGIITPAKLAGDTVFGDRMVVTDSTGTSFRFLNPNKLIHNSALNLYRVTDVDNARAWTAFSPTFYNNAQAGHYVMDLYMVRGGTDGNVNIKFNEFGDSTITVSATTFTQTITRSAVKTLSNFAGVPVVRQQIWEGTTLIGELGFYLARASDHSLGYWERWRWKPGYAHQNKSFNITRYLTLSFSANVG